MQKNYERCGWYYIPNGFRQYYLNRSQPPFFFLMVKDTIQAYVKAGFEERGDQLLEEMFPLIVEEHKFWMGTHSK